MGRSTAVIALTLLATTLAGKASAAECKPNLIGDMPVKMLGATPLVAAVINGEEVNFIIDSGSSASLLSADAVPRFKIKTRSTGVRALGVGGEFEVRTARLEDFTLGGFRVPASTFLVARDASVGRSAIGLFGQDFLANFDVEYDLANGRIRLFKPQGCDKRGMGYWAANVSVAEILPINPSDLHIRGYVSVNETRVRAVFDTGAASSILSLAAAARAGITPQSPGVTAFGAMRGLGGGLEAWLAPVNSFAVGTEAVKNARLVIGDLQRGMPTRMETGSHLRSSGFAGAEMLIGADFFLAHRIFVATSQRKLYFTYNGGGVFRPIPAAETSQPTTAEVTPVDASGFNRRGAAAMARLNFAGAIADFTRAIELEPQAAKHRHDRALAYLRDGKPDLAAADLDEALRLQPGDVDSLMTRGALYLRRDLERANADFDAAMALAPEDRDLLTRRFAIYMRAGMYREAIPFLDAWMVKSPRHPLRAEVLNSRCWARAVLGQELDKALEDCNAAISAERMASHLDSRALVWLKRGDFKRAIDDYDAALRLQPKSAWSLYARGLAKKRAGDITGGDVDMNAGLALDSTLDDRAKTFGLNP